MLNRTTLLLAALLISSVAYGGEIFKWKDKDGQIHFGDSTYQAKMENHEKVKLTGAAVTEAQRKEAEAIAAKSRMQVVNNPPAIPDPAPIIAPVAPNASTQNSQNPPDFKRKRKECQELWRQYRESQDCFAPYVIFGGGVRGEAFQHCSDIKQPTELCD